MLLWASELLNYITTLSCQSKNEKSGQSNNSCIPRLPRCIKTKDSKFTLSTLSNYIAFILLISILVDSNSGGLMRSFHMVLSQMTHLCSCDNHKSKKPALSHFHFSFRKLFMSASLQPLCVLAGVCSLWRLASPVNGALHHYNVDL